MSKFMLIAVLSMVMLLVGASVVLAQDAPVRSGHRMVQTPVAPTPGGTATAPDTEATPQGDGVCPMGGPGGGMGSMGGGGMMNGEDMQKMHESMQSSEDMQKMHDSMQNGTIEEMRATCQDAWERNQNPEGDTQPSSATGGNGPRNTAT